MQARTRLAPADGGGVGAGRAGATKGTTTGGEGALRRGAAAAAAAAAATAAAADDLDEADVFGPAACFCTQSLTVAS